MSISLPLTPNISLHNTHLQNLPDELFLYKILPMIDDPNDFASISLCSRKFSSLALCRDPDSFNCTAFLPKHVANMTNQEGKELSQRDKFQQAFAIQEKLFSDSPLQCILKQELPGSSIQTDPCLIRVILDHLILIPRAFDDPNGMVQLSNLKTKESTTHQLHNDEILACEVVNLPNSPLLVTASEAEKVKVWELNKITQATDIQNITLSGQEDVIIDWRWPNSKKPYFSAIATYDNMLAVVFSDCIKIWNLSSFPSIPSPSTLTFPDVQRIEFSSNKFIATSENTLLIWDADTLLSLVQTFPSNAIDTSSAIYRYELSNTIRFAKIFDENVVIAYDGGFIQGDSYIVGEVRNWKTGERQRLLAHDNNPRCAVDREFLAMDFHDTILYTISGFVTSWNFAEKENLKAEINPYGFNIDIFKVCALGEKFYLLVEIGCGEVTDISSLNERADPPI